MRVVIISHGHPDFSKGGGEIAAYNLYRGLNVTGKHDAWFIARAPGGLFAHDVQLKQHAEREYLVASGGTSEDLMASINLGPQDEFAALLNDLKPDVIHFHHYLFVGVELLRVARQACPAAKLVLTLHEFVAICLNDGMMLKTDGRLCERASPGDCHGCFPNKSVDWFFLRERYLKSFFNLVDLFVAPSRFVAERYVDWGLAPEKMRVIENGIAPGRKAPMRKLRTGEHRTRFAYFGQAHQYKGLDLILRAFGALPAKLRETVSLDIYASGLKFLAPHYRKTLEKLLQKHRDVAHYHGPYDQSDLPRLMAETDWVVMGSIWWENSPLVIQEAWKFGRPVICPELGGMAEKVEPGKGGLLFRARDSVALRGVVEQIATGTHPVNYSDLIARLPDYTTIESSVQQHLKAYARTRR